MSESENKNKKKLYIIIIAAVAVLAVIGLIIFGGESDKKDFDSDISTNISDFTDYSVKETSSASEKTSETSKQTVKKKSEKEKSKKTSKAKTTKSSKTSKSKTTLKSSKISSKKKSTTATTKHTTVKTSQKTTSVTSIPKTKNTTAFSVPAGGTVINDAAFLNEAASIMNSQRKAAGCSEIRADSGIAGAAAVRAVELSESFSHTRPDGTSFSSVYAYCGMAKPLAVAENITNAKKFYDAQDIFDQWLTSSAHKNNILNSKYTRFGLAWYKAPDGMQYAVLLLAN